MNKAQRAVLEDALQRAERGPSFGLSGFGKEAEAYFEEHARIWADTWIAHNIRAVLDEDVSAAELRYRFHV